MSVVVPLLRDFGPFLQRFGSMVPLGVMAAAFGGCEIPSLPADTNDEIEVTALVVVPESATLPIGGVQQFNARGARDAGDTISL